MIFYNARAIITKKENGMEMVLAQRCFMTGMPKHFEFHGGCNEWGESIEGRKSWNHLNVTLYTNLKVSYSHAIKLKPKAIKHSMVYHFKKPPLFLR